MKQKSLLKAWDWYKDQFEGYALNDRFNDYVGFIKQPLTLADFVPCRVVTKMPKLKYVGQFKKAEKKYIPLEKPAFFTEWINGGKLLPKHDEECFEYHQALDRVVYEGWEDRGVEANGERWLWNNKSGKSIWITVGDEFYVEHGKTIKTREDMEGFEMRENCYKKYFDN